LKIPTAAYIQTDLSLLLSLLTVQRLIAEQIGTIQVQRISTVQPSHELPILLFNTEAGVLHVPVI
jgi:hypothetical protein